MVGWWVANDGQVDNFTGEIIIPVVLEGEASKFPRFFVAGNSGKSLKEAFVRSSRNGIRVGEGFELELENNRKQKEKVRGRCWDHEFIS